MGYEITLYAGIKTEYQKESQYLIQYLMVELFKPGYDSNIYSLNKKYADLPDAQSHLLYLYGSDGNTQIFEDHYDQKLKAIPIDEVIESLKIDTKNYSYQAFKLALKSLKVLRKWYPESVVCLFGH